MDDIRPLISVIMPIYNAEKYVTKAIDSILSQSYSNIEVLLVDDGSQDRCLQICDNYAQKDKRVRVLHKNNGGQASARNLALDIVQGDYIGFVDADDWIEPYMYEILYSKIIQYGADLAICNFDVVTDEGHKHYWQPDLEEETVFDNNSLMEEILYNKRVNEMFWNKLFKKEILENERFVEGMIFEDTEMMHRCLSHVKKGVYIGKVLYNNYMSVGSTTRQNMKPKHFDRVKANINRIDFYKEYYPTLVLKANTSYVDMCLDLIDNTTGILICKEIRKETIRNLKKFLKHNSVIGSKKGKLAKFGSYFVFPVFYVCIRFPYCYFKFLKRR